MEGEHEMNTVKEDLEKELFTQYREYMDVHFVREKVDSFFLGLDKHLNVLKDLYLIWEKFISADGDKELLDFFSYMSPIVSGLAKALEVIGNELEFAPGQGLLHGTKRRALRVFIRFAEIKAKRIEDAVNLLNRKDALESRGLSCEHVLNHILDEIGLLEQYITGTVPEELPEDIKSKIDLFIELLLKANCFIVNLSSNRRDEYPVDDLNRMFNGLFEVLSEVKGMIVYDVKASDRYLDTIGGH